jgi:2-polyprenyl-3-methyl-5-hydroxy-6-metoxy-1,4-benzoquinol methylase
MDNKESKASIRNKQSIQEVQYSFPYHYIPILSSEEFSQTRVYRGGYEYLSYVNFILETIGKISFHSLLDVGCGDGRLLHDAAKTFPDKELKGIDISEKAIAFARSMATGVQYICGDITTPGIFRSRFDIITLIETLEHIEPTMIDRFLESIDHYLENDGRLILTVPSLNIKTQAKHYQHFDMDSLTLTLNQHFEISEAYFLNSTSRLVKRHLKKLLSNRVFILNHKPTLKALYRFYTKHFFLVGKDNCRRIALVCRKKSQAVHGP